MTVNLISITPDAEKTMAHIARVSNPDNQYNPNYAGFMKYCIKHNHWSVFEQSSMTLEIETTRAIAAQILILLLIVLKSTLTLVKKIDRKLLICIMILVKSMV